MNEEDEKPSYYSVLTADVRYDKNLSYGARLLYSEITALSGRDGYCYASNSYFSKAYGVSDVSIQNWLKNLKDCGYIQVSVNYKADSKEVNKRIITPIKEKFITPPRNLGDPTKKSWSPHQEILVENNNSYSYQYSSNTSTHKELKESNNKSISTVDSPLGNDFERFWNSYPKKVGKPYARQVFMKKVKHNDMPSLLEGLERYKGSKQWKDSQYIPNPSTFINQERWKDEVKGTKKTWNEMNDFEKEMFLDLAKEITEDDLK